MALTASVHARTAGNPFFVEEVAQNLIETGHLQGSRGNYRLMTPIDRLEVPATVRVILAARIDRLAEREKGVLQIASVIGKDFSEPMLADIAELAQDELKASLTMLRRAEFILERSIYPITEYSFKHPLTQEVALGSQLREKRRRVHAAVARAIEMEDADRLDERAALLAQHWQEAGEPLAAARWHKRAAEWVVSTDFAVATQHWGRLRALLRDLPGDREAATLGIGACMQLLNMSWRVGTGLDEAAVIFEEGRTLARSLEDRVLELHLSMMHARAVCGTGDVATYLDLAMKNEETALEVGDESAIALASMWVVDALSYGSRFPEALRKTEEMMRRIPRHVAGARDILGIEPHAVVVMWRGFRLGWMGRFAESLDTLAVARRMGDEDGTPEINAYGAVFAIIAGRLSHDAPVVLAAARQCEEISRRLGEPPVLVGVAQIAYGLAHLVAGRPADAIEPTRESLRIHAFANRTNESWSANILAEALLGVLDFAAAETAALEAIAIARRSSRPIFEAEANGILARILLRRDGVAARTAAEAALATAAELIERSGANGLLPSLCEWRAELAGVLGDTAACERLLRQAIQGYEAMGAPAQVVRLTQLMEAV